jgi:hypothetical protein
VPLRAGYDCDIRNLLAFYFFASAPARDVIPSGDAQSALFVSRMPLRGASQRGIPAFITTPIDPFLRDSSSSANPSSHAVIPSGVKRSRSKIPTRSEGIPLRFLCSSCLCAPNRVRRFRLLFTLSSEG